MPVLASSLDHSAAAARWAPPSTAFSAAAGRARAINGVALASTTLAFLAALEAGARIRALSRRPDSLDASPTSPGSPPGSFRADFALQVDQLTVIMLLVVTGVGWLIHIYSTGYMADDPGYRRFFSYLNLFMFFMLMLVLAANYL